MMLRLHCLSGSSWHLRGLPDFPPFVLPFLHVSPYVVSRRSCYCWCCLRHSLKAVGRNSTPGVFSHFAVCNLKFISIFILVINQLNAQNLFYSKFIIRLYIISSTMCSSSGGQNCIIRPLVSSHLQVAVPCTVLSQGVHRTSTYRCDDTRCCIIQF